MQLREPGSAGPAPHSVISGYFAMVTNVGVLGLEEAHVPLVPYSRVPLLLALGAIRETLVARDMDRGSRRSFRSDPGATAAHGVAVAHSTAGIGGQIGRKRVQLCVAVRADTAGLQRSRVG